MEQKPHASVSFQYGSLPESISKQTYSVHRDGQLIVSNHPMLNAVKQFVRANARDENAAGRTASYIVTGTMGFRSVGVMNNKGAVRWE